MNQTVITDPLISESLGDFSDNVSIRAVMTEVDFVAWSKAHEKIHAEWINGEVIPMSPASTRHVRLSGWLWSLLSAFARRRKLGEVFGLELLTRLNTPSGISLRVPDVLFIVQNRLHLLRENHFEGAPDLAVEIVSPDSMQRDWVEKRAEYELAGVREYWIIDRDAMKFEAFARDPQGLLTSIFDQSSGLFSSIVLPGLQFQVEWFWVETRPDPIEIVLSLEA